MSVVYCGLLAVAGGLALPFIAVAVGLYINWACELMFKLTDKRR